MRLIISKRGQLQKVLVHILLIAMVMLFFFYATAEKNDSRYLKQQVIEKQLALSIDAATLPTDVFLLKDHRDGTITSVRVEEGRVFVSVDGLPSLKGYPYYTLQSVRVSEVEQSFIVEVGYDV